MNRVYSGFWQRRGWTNHATIATTSIIRHPPANSKAGGKTPIAGIAFAGDRGIATVEVSMDGGQRWEAAKLKEPFSEYTWVLWAAEWNPSARGKHKLTVRATDKRGEVQTVEAHDSFPNGATGYHEIDIDAEPPS